jgi:hypothetical protein
MGFLETPSHLCSQDKLQNVIAFFNIFFPRYPKIFFNIGRWAGHPWLSLFPMFPIFGPLPFPRSLDGDLSGLVKAAEPFDWERIAFVLEVGLFIRWDGKSIYHECIEKDGDSQK